MESTTSALLQQIANNLEPLKNLNQTSEGIFTDFFNPVFAAVVTGALVSLVTLVLQDWFKRNWQKPKIKPIEVIPKFQKYQYIYRLVFTNDSNYLASNVEVDIIEVIDPDGKKRNFIPSPLRWTHRSEKPRSIFPHQPAYLDICEVKQEVGKFIMLAVPNLGGLDEMLTISKGITVLHLEYYEENGQTGKIKLEIKWNGKEDFNIKGSLPKIALIKD